MTTEIKTTDAKNIVKDALEKNNVPYDSISARSGNVMGVRFVTVNIHAPSAHPGFAAAREALKPYKAAISVYAPNVVQ